MSFEPNEDPLERLRAAPTPVPPAARARAISAARAAFAEGEKKSATAAKGAGFRERLTSIFSFLQGKTIMDMRIPVGSAALLLLLLPLGVQLYSTTGLTPPATSLQQAEPVPPPPPVADAAVPAPAEALPRTGAPAEAGRAPEPMLELESAPMPMAAPAPSLAPSGIMAESDFARQAPPLGATQPSGDSFAAFDEQRLHVVAEEPVSTFSVDVDTASYSYVRRMLEDGLVPEPDAVRIEELINYFPYDYPAAPSAEVPFEPTMAVYPTPWNPATQLLQIGIKGYVPPATEDRPSNLVFLIDTSGSMDEPDKLPLLKRAFTLLLSQLSGNDTVSIVAYAGSAGVVLEPTVATDKAKIVAALDQLGAGGSTAGAEGIELAYRLAEDARVEGGTNRVILATDGDFNVGIDDPAQLEGFIKAKRDTGVTLSVLGFGQGNLDDATMQALAQNGNGNASYIASFREAQKVLVEELGGTLDTIANDVKIQVEFNPATVAEYRLIGYETRALNREDFRNDAVDAGDVGAGHTVTALYEITPVGSAGALVDPLRYGTPAVAANGNDELALLRLRYKLPDSDSSQLIEQPVTPDLVHRDMAEVRADMRFAAAVAAFGQKLKGSAYGRAMSWDAIADLARAGRGEDEGGYRAEFIGLVRSAALLKP